MIPLQAQFSGPRGATTAAAPVGRERRISIQWLVALLLLHAALAWVEKGRSILVTLHGFAILGVALFYGTDPSHPERTIQAVAYLCGAEVLWRMCAHSSGLPWEFGKYASVMIMFLAILRRGHVSWLPLLYIALLLPSVPLTMADSELWSPRQAVSDSLSGPLAIAVAFAFMSQVTLTPRQVCRTLLCFAVPMTGVAFLCYSGTFGASEVFFNNDSNKAASGGYGPNQVSAALGFGVLCGIFCLLTGEGRLPLKGLLLLLCLWFGVQSGLTFSRTGLYLVGICTFTGVLPLLRNARARWAALASVVILFVVVNFALLPMLNNFTGGAFEERFENQSLTHRDDIMLGQMRIWLAHPILGVGPGVVDSVESSLGFRAHTEYTRLVAEHGAFGIAALIILLSCVYRAFRQARTPYAKAFCLAMATYGLLFMAVSSTRLAVVALAFGLASVRVTPENKSARKLVPRESRTPPRRLFAPFASRHLVFLADRGLARLFWVLFPGQCPKIEP